MSTSYPGGIDTYTAKVDGVSTVAAADTNNLQDAMVAVQTALGTNPGSPNVRDAIAAKLPRNGSQPMIGNLDLGDFRIVNLADPEDDTDAVTKAYAEELVSLSEGINWSDDFLAVRAANWTLSGTGATYTQNAELGGTGTLSTGATTSNEAKLRFGGSGFTDKTKEPEVQTRAKLGATTQLRAVLAGLYKDDNNLIEIYYDVTTPAGNFMYRCKNGGTETTANSNLAADTNYHTFYIMVESAQVQFSIDEGNSATITTNIPTALLEPNLSVQTKENADKSITVDYIQILSER